jgi:APA family basic amino acid/polyamine antiporter
MKKKLITKESQEKVKTTLGLQKTAPVKTTSEKKVPLKRTLSLPILTLYGLGTIVGAGIYVLIGTVAGRAGIYAPISFLIAAIIAAFSAFTFAELSSRLPKAASMSLYMQQSFKVKALSITVGLLVVLAAIISSATLTSGFNGYMAGLVDLSPAYVTMLLLILLSTVAILGITHSALLAIISTGIELFGLALIFWVTRSGLTKTPELLTQLTNVGQATGSIWVGIFLGAFISFFAFIGFEDMVTITEEVKNPRKNVPLAILIALALATIIYLLITISALTNATPEELASSDAPLALIYQNATGASPVLITIISLFAIIGGILVQIVMASRILYGISRKNWIPQDLGLGLVNQKTRTPIIATLVVSIMIASLALWLDLESLATTTVFITLIIFLLCNVALIIIKKKDPRPKDAVTYPMILPILGAITSFGLLVVQILNVFGVI